MKNVAIKPVEYFVGIEWSKPSFMQFLGAVPADYYKLYLVNENEVRGIIVGVEIMEYLTNEILLRKISYLSREEYSSLASSELKAVGSF